MRHFLFTTYLLTFTALGLLPAQARVLNIVTDIAPVRAIAQSVSGSLQKPIQLIGAGVSAHDFALKPSDIRKLQQADLIIWLGPQATPGLAKLLRQEAFKGKALSLSDVAETSALPLRKPGRFEDGLQADDMAPDPHQWLDPENGKVWAQAIAGAMRSLDPDNADIYAHQVTDLIVKIDEVTALVRTDFVQASPLPYLQYHDAFQYFEAAFSLSPLGAAAVEDEENTSLGTIAALRDLQSSFPISCVFVQNKQQEKRARALLETSGVRVGYLDALGRDIPAEAYSYPALLTSIASGFAACLHSDR